MTTDQYAVTLATITCTRCGITFAVPEHFMSSRKRDHENFWCPNGDQQYFPGESDVEQARRQRDAARAREVHLRDQLEAERRSAAAVRGHLTRARKRIANGVCPVPGCRRHFDNVQAHIASVHPTYRVDEEEH